MARLCRSLCFLLLLGATGCPALAQSGYHLLSKIKIGGEGGWDYVTVDSAARRLYVSHSTQVEVLDVDRGAVVGKIPDTKGVHGIALAPELNRGFTSNGREDAVTIFDLKTLGVLGQAKTGRNPDAILYDPASRRVFTFNGGSRDATAIEAATGAVAGTIELGGRPEFAVADGEGTVYVNLEDKSTIVALDSRKLAVKTRWPLAPCEDPSSMAMDRKNARLFIGCRNRLMAVVDYRSGKVLATLPIGQGVDATVFDPESALVFNSNGDGTITVVQEDSPDKFHVVENVATQRGARTIALDSKTHKLFLPVAEYGSAPAATPEQPRPRPSIVPDTFTILVVGK